MGSDDAFILVDDGTLDTVIECRECGGQERFDSGSLLPAGSGRDDGGEVYTDDELDLMRVATAFESCEIDHECEERGDV